VASKSLEEWLKILWEKESEYVLCGVFLRLCSSVSRLPLRLGVRSPFYRPRGQRVTCTPRYLAT
jgi:hypothetical protein